MVDLNQKQALFREIIATTFWGQPIHWVAPNREFNSSFADFCTRNSLDSLMYSNLKKNGYWEALPANVRENIAQQAKGQAMLEDQRRAIIVEVVQALAKAKIDFLIFKGSALAYSLYSEPYLRPRQDTDILIRSKDIPKTEALMHRMGYVRQNSNAGDLISSQVTYSKDVGNGIEHHIDFHWEMSNSQAFRYTFVFDELIESARPLTMLHPDAFSPDDLNALAIACVHRVAHHFDDENLIWLYDIHLLLEGRTNDWLISFVQLARKKGVASLCAHGIDLTSFWFETKVPSWFLNELRDHGKTEFSAQFLHQRRNWIHDLVLDLKALPTWRQRAQLVKEHALPPEAYMMKKYKLKNRALLPAAYAFRFTFGLRKILSKTKI